MADWGLIGAIGGILGGIAGVFSLGRAAEANRHARSAVAEAKTSNRLATEANTVALEALRLSEESGRDTQMARLRFRPLKWNFTGPDLCFMDIEVLNFGKHDAFNVTLSLSIADQVVKLPGKPSAVTVGQSDTFNWTFSRKVAGTATPFDLDMDVSFEDGIDTRRMRRVMKVDSGEFPDWTIIPP